MTGRQEAIAIIGMSGRFPEAANVAELWENLKQGRECVRFFSREELLAAGVSVSELDHPRYVRANAMVEGIDLFDAEFFAFSPRDAELLDPQHRVFMECAWEALESGGYDPDRYGGLIGVYAGTTMSTYAWNLYSNPTLAGVVSDFQILLGNDKDHLSTRTAYKLNLRGPAITLGTACSTSLVAVCQACQALLDYQVDLALAGGVTLGVPQIRGYLYEEGGIASPDGRCRSFDADARGTVGGNGAGCVLLKRLSDAVADGDSIVAVIRGFGLNNDGSAKVGYTAPSVDGQARAIAAALAMAEVEPATVTMVEAHGTATPLGDVIEIQALREAYARSATASCALGSLKSNLGHLDSAAGVAGLIKCALSLKHRQIPASLHFREPNPRLALATSPFFVNTALRDWQPACGVRRAGLSSFGIGGTNAHLVLEEAPEQPARSLHASTELLVLSARSARALDDAAGRLAAHLQQHSELALADVAHTLQQGRREFSHRRCVLVGPEESAASVLLSKDARRVLSGVTERAGQIAFLLPGQGCQFANMGLGLYRSNGVFRDAIDHCARVLTPLVGLDLRELLYPPAGREAEATFQLRQTLYTQPAVFSVSYAFARFWEELGVRPAALIGHSVGEYTAACLAGVFELDDALLLVAERARLLSACPTGAMLAVALAEDELRDDLPVGLELAAVNAPKSCVVSGDAALVRDFAARLLARQIPSKPLETSHAFHSARMEGAVQGMQQAVSRVARRAPDTPFVSNVTGQWITNEQARSPAYWARHLRQPVLFSAGLAQILQQPDTALLEVGPGTTLTRLARQHPNLPAHRSVVPTSRHAQESADDTEVALRAVAELWLTGHRIAWSGLSSGEARRRVPLPTYPFERQRYWIDPAQNASRPAPAPSEHGAPVREPFDHWFFVPRWVRSLPAPAWAESAAETWLLIGARPDEAEQLQRVLEPSGQHCITLTCDESTADGRRQLRRSVEALIATGRVPRRVVQWASGAGTDGFCAAMTVVQAIAKAPLGQQVTVLLLTNRGQQVLLDDNADPYQGMLSSLAVTAHQEYPDLACRLVDLEGPVTSALARQLVNEACADDSVERAAYRGQQRWLLTYEPAPLAKSDATSVRGGVFALTGGLGRIGLLFADYLARQGAAVIALLSREVEHAPRERIRAIEAWGAQVELLQVDVADAAALSSLLQELCARRGPLRGVVHGAGNTKPESFVAFGEVDEALCEAHFAPKLHGTEALVAGLAQLECPPEFVMFQSSISAVLGGLGFCAYAAANAFLDGVAWRHGRDPATRWISVNWDGWFLGTEPEALTAAGNEPVILGDDGVEAFERLLAARDLKQVLVSTSSLAMRLETWLRPLTAANQALPALPAASAGHERPDALSTDYEAPQTALQGKIALIWQELLGIDPIGIHDNFFELGGHSLLAIQVISRLRGALHRDVPVRMLFDHPSIYALERALQADQQADDAERIMLHLLGEVEGMTDDQVKQRLTNQELSN